LIFAVCLLPFALPLAVAADLPPVSSSASNSIPDPNLLTSPDASAIEEGKALYENGQLIAALGKFMAVLRNDPHNPDARQYLRLIIDTMRQNPSVTSSKIGTSGQAVTVNPAVQEEIRLMLQLRSRLMMDLGAIPGVQMNVQNNVNQIWIDTSLLFGDNSGGLREQGIPILDRTAAWLKTYGQQPAIIHCYPEELQAAGTNGSLFLHRYSELFNYFVEERKLSPQRFVSADLLKNSSSPLVGEDKGGGGSPLQNPPSQPSPTRGEGVQVSSAASHIVIETIGAQSSMIEDMPSMAPGRLSSQWLEDSIVFSRKIFNPEEGEWVNLDLAALSRSGLREWNFTLTPVGGKSAQPVLLMSGKGNLLMRLGWDGHDQKTGNFVPAGNYTAKLVSTNSDGTIKSREDILQVDRTTQEEPPVLVEKPKAKKHAKAKKPKVTPTASSPADNRIASSPAVAGRGSMDSPPTAAGNDVNKSAAAAPISSDSGESVHTIWKQVIQFDPNQSEPMPTVKSSLERIGKTLEVYPLQKVRITGFAMASETDAATLARKRAEVVRSILVEEYHVDAKRVIVAGGKIAAGDNASRVEMSITN